MTPEPQETAPSERPSLLEPSRLEPVDVNLRRVFLAGTALWGLALVACLVLNALGITEGANPAVCLTGMALGGLALVWDQRQRVRAARGETLT